MVQKNREISYFNTLIFTIVAGVVSLILLSTLFFSAMKPYLVGIVTIEIGIFIIIGYCIYKIVKNDNTIRDLMKKNKIVINFDECGDYYVKRTDSAGKMYCTNDYIITDDTNRKFIMKIVGSNMNVPGMNKINYSSSNTAFYRDDRTETYMLRELADNSNMPTYQEKCKPLYEDVSGLEVYKPYKNIPWTYARSRCDSFYSA